MDVFTELSESLRDAIEIKNGQREPGRGDHIFTDSSV